MIRFDIIRLLAISFLAVVSLAANAQSGPYDGDYAGVGILTTDETTIRHGDSCANTENFNVHIRNGQVSMSRQVTNETVSVSGSVAGDGSVSGYGPSHYGGVNLKGKISHAVALLSVRLHAP
jgi:hypothetical protein